MSLTILKDLSAKYHISLSPHLNPKVAYRYKRARVGAGESIHVKYMKRYNI